MVDGDTEYDDDASVDADAVAADDEAYDFGQGAGFYLNATEMPWARNFHMYDYIFFAYLCMSFVFMNLIQVPISSLQVKILRIIKKNNGLKESKIYNIYNANHIFEERFNTLLKNIPLDLADWLSEAAVKNKFLPLIYLILFFFVIPYLIIYLGR